MADDVVVMYLGQVVEKAPVDEIFHAPKHPYTQALLESIPRLRGASNERLGSITGSVPHAFNRPTGCPFHPRCSSYMQGLCELDSPRLLPITRGHEVSCFLHHRG